MPKASRCLTAVACAAVLAAGAALPRPAAAVTVLPANLGPTLRVGLAYGAGAAASLEVTAAADPDRSAGAVAYGPALSVTVAVSLTAASQAAAADPALAAGAVAPLAVRASPSSAAAWALGPATVDVLGQGLSDQAATALAASVPSAAVAAIGPSGLSVVVPTAADTGTALATLTATGALAGPYPDLATAHRAAAVLGRAGLWAVAAFAPQGAGAGAWYARVLASLPNQKLNPIEAAQASASAAVAALSTFLPAAPVTALAADSSSLLVVAGGEATIASAVLVAPAAGALSLTLGHGAAAAYAGDLALARVHPGGGLWVVNDVPLERYVAGVVPAEMPSSWPLAALEAQAVASRSYALSAALNHPLPAPYSLTNGPSDQVYGGLSVETAATDAATWATAGQVLTYEGTPIAALYEADSGGSTANSVDVWGNAVPYLVRVAEPKGYVSPHRWTISMDPKQLEALALQATGTDPGPVDAVTPLVRERGSERVLRLALTGPLGTAYLTNDGVRTGLDLPSNMFRVTTPGAVEVEGATGRRRLLALSGAGVRGARGAGVIAATFAVAIQSATGSRTLQAAAQSFVFVGRGFGPGLGMSQDGARFLAAQGDSARQILLYYYRGAALSQWYGEGSA